MKFKYYWKLTWLIISALSAVITIGYGVFLIITGQSDRVMLLFVPFLIFVLIFEKDLEGIKEMER